jgi:UrcA family protein
MIRASSANHQIVALLGEPESGFLDRPAQVGAGLSQIGNHMLAKACLPALAAFTVLGSTATAIAAPDVGRSADPDVVSITVFIGDLNLRSQAGARIALRRIERAATSTCGGEPDIRRLDRWVIYRECMHSAVDQAVASLDSPIVTALYSGRDAGVEPLASDR